MTKPDEDFVNAALDKALSSDVTLPAADEIPVFTGIGRQVTGKTTTELGIATTTDVSDVLVDANEPLNAADLLKVWKDQSYDVFYCLLVHGLLSANTVVLYPLKLKILMGSHKCWYWCYFNWWCGSQ